MSIADHINHAIKLHGSQVRLAEAIGCSQQQISYLLKAKKITAEMAMKLDVATGGEVSKHILRPDIFGGTGQQATNQNTSPAEPRLDAGAA
jgi:DNA-binding transcriptional regulator YdaS (Cro superfamily)